MNAAHQRRLTPVLGGIVVALAALLLLLLAGVGRGVRWPAPRGLSTLPPAGNSADLPQPKPLQQFSPVWQKPLFNPDRKPIAHVAAGGSNLGDLELTGIIIGPGLRMALLRDRNANKEIRLREGATLPDGSVTLVEVHQRSAVFDAAAGRTELKLPAGAPIDQVRGGADDGREQPPSAPGEAAMRVLPGDPERADDDAERTRPMAPVTQDQRAQAAIEQLRRTIRKRRDERAAASHEGEH